jgi:putative membrane protein
VTTDVTTTTETPWRQLHRRTVVVTALTVAGIAIGLAVPFVAGFVGGGSPALTVLGIAGGAVVVVTVLAALGDLMRWRHTTYRVTDERVEMRHQWVLHKVKSIPRERVRTVDLIANPLLRIFGLTTVKIGTGERQEAGNQLTLDPVDREHGEELRRLLLSRPATADADEPADEHLLASIDWSWIRYAPISIVTPILGAAAFGAVMQVSDWIGAEKRVFAAIGDVNDDLGIVWTVVALAVIGVVIGVVGSLGLFVEMWWRYRLEREETTLRVRRGLFTTRSLTMERRRLRGVDVFEPLGARLAGAARVDVVATGMRKKSDQEKTDPTTLLPTAPAALAHRVAAAVLGVDASPQSTTTLHPHPVAARGRRIRWALWFVLVVVGVLALLGALLTVVLLHIAWITAVVLLPVSIALAVDDYRNLGHGLSEEYLLTRYGAGSRHTVALVRSGVIGWTVRRSPFQRRAGLITLSATTAANDGEYFVRDVGESAGLRFAEEAVPGLLTPFLQAAPRR